MRRFGSFIAAVRALLLASVAGGSGVAHAQVDRDDADWRAARAEGSQRAFERYLERNPTGRYAGEAFVIVSRMAVAEGWSVGGDPTKPDDGFLSVRTLAPNVDVY
jgi:hypothetical protein